MEKGICFFDFSEIDMFSMFIHKNFGGFSAKKVPGLASTPAK